MKNNMIRTKLYNSGDKIFLHITFINFFYCFIRSLHHIYMYFFLNHKIMIIIVYVSKSFKNNIYMMSSYYQIRLNMITLALKILRYLI
jgi:hypothetical protein